MTRVSISRFENGRGVHEKSKRSWFVRTTSESRAIATMFRRHGFPDQDAFIRARIVYYMQIGYYSVDLREALRARIANLAAYVRAFTGVEPDSWSCNASRG